MNFLFLFLVVPVIGVKAEDASGDDTSKKTEYTINAKRTENTIPAGHPVIYMYYKVSDPQNLTYFKNIDDHNPFILEYYLINDAGSFEYSGSDVNACGAPEEPWDYVAAKLIQGNLMPDGGCPVKKGSYDVSTTLDPIKVTFPEKIHCGVYTYTMNADRADEWAAQIEYQFNIPDNCIR